MSADLKVGFGLNWHEADAFGLALGPAKIEAQLSERVLRAAPIEFDVASGKFRLTPQLPLQSPLTITLAPGVLADQVEVTPELCQRWLKYVAPLVADATSANGRFTLRLARARIPLTATHLTSAGGSLAIHSAQVGPGPAAQELLSLAQKIRAIVKPNRGTSQWLEGDQTWIELPDQVASFRVQDGRVAHENLTMVIGDMTIRTRGWVGFNQQMAITAEIPVQEDWIAENPWLESFRGESIEIPIRGNVTRPALDRRVVQTLTRKAAAGAAQGLLKNELKQQLNKLFK